MARRAVGGIYFDLVHEFLLWLERHIGRLGTGAIDTVCDCSSSDASNRLFRSDLDCAGFSPIHAGQESVFEDELNFIIRNLGAS